MNLPASPLMLLLVLAVPAAFAAEDVYRSTMPDGTVFYGETPRPGAKQVRKVPPPPVSTGTIVVTPEEKARYGPKAIEEPTSGVAVIPVPAREPAPALEQGRSINTDRALPKRSY
jgi:Domain of unknown function (DUF4124)